MSAAEEWREGWLLVVVAAAGTGLCTAPTYSVGAFMAPLTAAFGWTRAEIATALSIATVISSLAAPMVGRLVDRWGARRIALIGAVLACATFASLSTVNGSIVTYRAIWALGSVGIALCSPLVWSIAVATRFSASRGLALSIALTGSNISGVMLPPLATGLIQRFGWRGAYVGLALCMFVYAVPAAIAFFYDAGDLERRRGKRSIAGAPNRPAYKAAKDGLILREAMRTPTFWLMLASFPIGGGAMVSMVVHMIPLLLDRGLSPMIAASAASMMSVGAVAGRVPAGFFLDKVFAPRIAAVAFTPPILACIGLVLLPTTVIGAVISALLFGLALGAEGNLISYLTARYFGFKSYGLVYGVQFAVFSTGCGLMPPLIGMIYQANGNYQTALVVLAGCYFVSAGLLQFCGPYPDRYDGERRPNVEAPIRVAPRNIARNSAG